MMHLVTIPLLVGNAVGGWRHPRAWRNTVMSFDKLLHLTRTAERGLFDAVFFADGNSVRQMHRPDLFAMITPSDRPANFEPVTLLTALGARTENIGLVATASTTFEEPYLLARKFASLDILSGGRAGWNIVTTSTPEDSVNFNSAVNIEKSARYRRANEFVEVTKGLWDSWADDAFIEDQANGRYLDPSRVHTLNHDGEFLKIQGPLNIKRPIQGYPTLFTAGQSNDGRELAARHAEGLFAIARDWRSCKELADDVRARMPKYLRRPEDIKILPGVGFFVGETDEEADRLYNEVGNLIPPKMGVEYLEKQLSINLKGYDLDDRMPAIDHAEVNGINSIRQTIAEDIEANNWTVREAYKHVTLSVGQPIFKGSPTRIADRMEEWYASGACDGFFVQTPVPPFSFERFVDLVVPELQRRGLYKSEYQGRTLREHMGLAKPENPFFPADITA